MNYMKRRKPLGALVASFIKDEYEKSGMSKWAFGTKYGITHPTIQKILESKEELILKSNTIDSILIEFDITLVELSKKYGEYYD